MIMRKRRTFGERKEEIIDLTDMVNHNKTLVIRVYVPDFRM